MSKYTVELRWLVEQYITDAGHPVVPFDETYWSDTYTRLGLANYPIFDASYRQKLNDKIIRHFYVREIGFETAGLFRHYMNLKMQEIMPYYNQLYLSEQLEFDPLSTRNMSYHEEWNRDNTDDWSIENNEDWNKANTGTQGNRWTSSNDTESDSTNSDREVFQDTPMSLLDNPAPNPVQKLQYATTVTYQDGETQSNQHATGNGDNTRTDNLKEIGDRDNTERGDRDKNEKGLRDRTEKGYDLPGSDMLKKYRDTFLNIDMMIINELETLFMGIG